MVMVPNAVLDLFGCFSALQVTPLPRLDDHDKIEDRTVEEAVKSIPRLRSHSDEEFRNPERRTYVRQSRLFGSILRCAK